MTLLSAVNPERGGVVHSDSVGGEVARERSIDGREARVESLLASERGKLALTARVTERGLCRCVVLRSELENDSVAGCSSDRWRIIGEGSITTDDDAMLSALRGNRGRSRRVGVRLVDSGPNFVAEGDGLGDCGMVDRSVGLAAIDVRSSRSHPRGRGGVWLTSGWGGVWLTSRWGGVWLTSRWGGVWSRGRGGSFRSAVRQCRLLVVLKGMITSGGAVDGEDHSFPTVARLLAVEPDRLCVLHSVVPGGEIGCLISTDSLETAVEDGLLGVLVEKGLADLAKGRLGYSVVLLLECEPHSVAGVSKQSLRLEQERIRGGATDGDFMHRGRSDRGKGKGSERNGKHYEQDARGIRGYEGDVRGCRCPLELAETWSLKDGKSAGLKEK